MGFSNFYNNLRSEFEKDSKFTCIKAANNRFHWPESSGVYVIWESPNEKQRKLIYIGMTGKFQKNISGQLIFNNSSFRSRLARWTPYRFCESDKDGNMKYHFRYNPKESKTLLQGQIKHNHDAYEFSIPYENLEIHCFHVNSDHEDYTPVFIESLLLTKYLKLNGDLPPANNSL